MSIVRSLQWLFDRNQYREEIARQKRWMKPKKPGDPDGGPDPEEEADVLAAAEHERQRAKGPLRCRVCGRLEEEKPYCPECLAETLVRS